MSKFTTVRRIGMGPYCFSVEKFDLIGKIVLVEDETAPEVIPEEQPADAEPVQEACDACKEGECKEEEKELKEDLENVTIETEDEIINVSAEEKPEVEEMPLELPAEEEKEEEEPEHEKAEVIAPLDDEEMEDEIDEVDEESFDEFAESLLREKYNNIVSYKTTKMKDCGNHIMTEGVVTLKNGDKKLTEFRIRPSKFSRDGKGACLVENIQLNTRKIARAYVTEGLFGNKDNTAASPEYLFKKAVSKFKTANSGNILVTLMTKQGKAMTSTGMKFSDRKEAEAFAKMAKDAGYKVEIGRG